MLDSLAFLFSIASFLSGIFCLFLLIFLAINRLLFRLNLARKSDLNWRARIFEFWILSIAHFAFNFMAVTA